MSEIRDRIEAETKPGAELLLVADIDATVHVIRTEEGISPCVDVPDDRFNSWDWIDWSIVVDFRVIKHHPSDLTPLDKLTKAIEEYSDAVNGSSSPCTTWALVYQTSEFNPDKYHNTQFPVRYSSSFVAHPMASLETTYGLFRIAAERLLSDD